MSQPSIVETAALIMRAHGDQQRSDGKPYYTHPIAVASLVKSDDEKRVALLHDTVEDTKMTFPIMHKLGFSREVIDAVALLTKRKDQDYLSYIHKIKNNKLARTVKFADMVHNLSDKPSEKQKHKYFESFKILL